MNIAPQAGDMHMREASKMDIPFMAAHHRKMFEEIWEEKGRQIDPASARELENAYTQKLEADLQSGTCRAWVIEDRKTVVSSGAITVVCLVPVPSDLSSKVAYVHSMYTEKSHRNRKCAQRIIYNMIAYCKSAGIKRIQLHASDAGQPVYQKLGFQPAPDTMRLFIEQSL